MKITNRGLHRDLAYFYVGLVIAFSFSGILLNHRQSWYPKDYVYETQSFSLALPQDPNDITEEYMAQATQELGEYDGHRLRNGKLRVYFTENIILDLDAQTGEGSVEYRRVIPLVGHATILHKSTDGFWIWYSDIFGAAMLVIAITGILIPIGKNGFKSRGWKLALAGMLFPLLFLIVLS